MKERFAVFILVLLFAAVSRGQGEADKYVGQYQVTGAPVLITVTAKGPKLAIQATGQPKIDIDFVSGEDYTVAGTAIRLTFQRDAAGKVTGMVVHQAPGVDVQTVKINSSKEEPSDKSPHKSHFLTANGIKMNYLDWGGSGEVIILLAGFGNDAHIFDDFAPTLTDKYHVVGLTRRGFGETERPATGYDTATRVEDVRAFMDAAKFTRATIIGHSLAGDEMTLFAGLYPDRVNRLVYLDAAYDRTKNFSCGDDRPGGGLPPLFLRLVSEVMKCPGAGEIVVPDMPPPDMYNVYISTFRSLLQYHPDYTKVKAPSLAIYADIELPESTSKLDDETAKKLAAWWKVHETPRSRASIEQFRTDLKNSQVAEIKGAGHYVFITPFKDQVVKLIREFLAK